MTSEDPKSDNLPNITIEQRDRLIEVLESLEDLTKRQISLKLVFVRGLIYGLGTVIGATVLISVLSFIAVQFFGGLVADEAIIERQLEEVLE